MPGEWIKLQQAELYMKARRQGYTQIVAAAKAGISERSGREIEQGKRKNPWQTKRWRSRADPLADVWDRELRPLLEQTPSLTAITLLEYLQDQYTSDYPDSLLRTLQRRVKQWKALYGPEKEVMFRQVHEIARLALSDFTKLKTVKVTIRGELFEHLLYHFRLVYSHWSFMKVIQGGESYPALAQGLQEALQKLGGVPKEHRTDSLSAAFKNLKTTAQEDMTLHYEALCRHYGMTPTRNNRGRGHENGSVESSHGHLKRRIEQALLLRGSYDFESVQMYQDFIDVIVEKANRRNAKTIEAERKLLQPLPQTRAVDYKEQRVVVTRSSTIDIRRVIYTVPSRLQGEVLNVRIYDDRLEVYLGSQHVITLPRLHLNHKNKRGRQVDYRHVIHSLVKKPQAFRYSQLRNELLPDANYRFIWQSVNKSMPPLEACKFIVGLLHLAATYNCEKLLGEKVVRVLKAGQTVSLTTLQKQFCKISDHPDVKILHHSLDVYNQLIPQPVEQRGYHE